MSINVTPIPRLINLGAPAFTLGTSNAAGDAITAVASNSTLLAFDTVLPAVTSSASSAGSATVAGRRDHVHASSIAATQAEEEAASSTAAFTSPGMQKYHPGVSKGWVNYSQNTDTINSSYNVASVTDSSAGNSTINWTVDFSTANHCSVGMLRNVAATNEHISVNAAPAAGATSISTAAADGTRIDALAYFVAVFGEQVDA